VLSRNRETFAVSSLFLKLFASQIGEFFLPHSVQLWWCVLGELNFAFYFSFLTVLGSRLLFVFIAALTSSCLFLFLTPVNTVRVLWYGCKGMLKERNWKERLDRTSEIRGIMGMGKKGGGI